MADVTLGIKITADGKGAEATVANLNRTIEKVGDSSRKASQSLSNVERATRGLGSAASAASAALSGIGVALSAREIIQSATQFDSLRGMMEAASGSAAAAATNMAFVRKVANDLGLEVVTTAQAFAKLNAAAIGTSLQGAATQKIFQSVAKASASLGLSADETSGALLAISQMMSKGKVSAEELRGQLGERLPGAFQVAARAMGVTTAQLDEMLAQGKIVSDDFLPKFAAELDKTFSAGRFDRVGNEINRLTNAWTALKESLIDTEGVAKGIRAITTLLSDFNRKFGELTGNSKTSFRDALARRIEEQERVVEKLKKGLGGWGGFFIDKEEIAQREREIASMEATLAKLNQELSTDLAQGIGQAVSEGIQKAAPPKVADVMQLVAETAKKYNVPEAFALAIAKTESNFNQSAVSSAGARGVMQLMPGTAKDLEVNAAELVQNVDGGVRFIKQLMAKFHGDLRLVAAAYNAGPYNKSLAKGQVPNIKETQDYVRKVDAAYQDFYNKYPNGMLFADSKSQQQEYKDAEDRFNAHINELTSIAERSSKEEDARRRTAFKQVELDRKQAEDAAKAALDGAKDPAQRQAIIEQLRAAEESAAQRSKQLIEDQIAAEQRLLEVKRSAIEEELANADRYNLSISERARLQQDLLGVQSELRMLSDDRAQAEIAAAERQLSVEAQLRGMAKERQKDEQAVKERQLRENAFWDQLIGRVQEYAAVWQQIGEGSSNAFGTMAVAAAKFVKNIDQIHESYQAVRDAAEENGQDTTFLDWAEGAAQAQNAINMVAQSLITVRDQYEKGTAEYKKYDQAAAGVAIAAKVAAIAEGVLAVVHQMSSGDPYSAIPRALAVAAMVASMGISTGASGSGGISDAAQKRRDEAGTGTVFGDPTAQSASIANSLEIIKSNSTNDLNYSAAMLRALEDLSLNILALANQVTMNVMPSIDAALQASGMQFGKQNISLFSGFNTQLTDSGIGWFEASLDRILKGDFTAKMYADITKSFEVMQSAISESTKTYVRDASSEVSNQIVMIFRDIVKAFEEGVKAFGLTTDSVLTALKGFKVGMEQISLQDMTMEEQTAALNAVFSKITDQMAGVLNRKLGLALGPFRKAGEGMAETFFRVSEGITRAKNEMEQFGLTAVDYKTLSAGAKQGDVAAEIVRQTLTTQMMLADGVKAYVNELQGSAEDIIDATKKLINASNLLKTAGIGDANLNRDMINAAGGLDAFNSAMEAFNQNFLSQGQNTAGEFRILGEQFAALGYTIPSTREGFRDLITGFTVTDAASAKLFGQLVALSEGMAKVFDETERLTQKYASMLDPMFDIRKQIETVGSDFDTLIGKAIAPITGAATEGRNLLAREQNGINEAFASRSAEITVLSETIDKLHDKLRKELAKKPKNQNKKLIQKLEDQLGEAEATMRGLYELQLAANERIKAISQELANIDVQEGIDKAAAKAPLLLQARDAMAMTLEEIFNGLAQSIQAAQQRLQSVLNLQKSLASQLAQLQGPGAVFNLASADRNTAFGAIDTYIASLSDGRARNVETEVGLLNDAQAAVMAKYNAEIAAIQEAEQAFIAAETERLNEALNAQIKAINDALDAQIKAQSKLDAAAQKAMQKTFDAEQKALQKAHDAQLKALGDELDAANKLADAIKNINEYVRGMALGGNSPLSPEAKLAEAQRQYQDLLARAQGGDADAMQRLTGASDAYLEASKAYYGSGTQYANTFDAVKNAMSAIGGMSAPDPDSIQSRIDALREAQAEEMDALRELQSEKLDALREKQQDAIDAMREAAQKQIEAAQKATQQAIADLSDPNKNAAMKAAREAAERDLAELARLAELTRKEAEKQAEEAKQKAEEQAAAAIDMANKQLAALDAGLALSEAQLGALNSILINNGLQPVPVTARAKGGYTPAGMTLVGEQGPELVRFTKPGQVYNATDTKSMLSDDEKIVAAIAELKAEMRAVVVTQSNANPQIIEKLSGMEQRLSKMERTQRFNVGA